MGQVRTGHTLSLGVVLLLVICAVCYTAALVLPVQQNPRVITNLAHSNKRHHRSTSSEAEPLPSYRLLKTVNPEKYQLTISPILEKGFESTIGEQWYAPGSVVITVTAVKATKTITLHAKNITIHNVTVINDREGVAIPVKNISHHERHAFLKIHLQTNLHPGDVYDIRIHFTAFVSEVLNGMNESKKQTSREKVNK